MFARRQFLGSLLSTGILPWMLRAEEIPQAKKEVSWLAEVRQKPEQLPPNLPRLEPLLVDALGQPIRTLGAWNHRRRALRQWWLDFLTPLDVKRERAPRLEILAEDRLDTVVRQLVRYEVEPGVLVEAYLLKPRRVSERRPGVLALHSTTDDTIHQPAGVRGQPEKAFGLKAAERGFVAFCPCNFLWPDGRRIATQKAVQDLRARHPGATGMAKMLFGAVVALDILASQPEVDSQRLVAIGHSLGAKEVLYLAALDERVRVAVSSEGGIGTRFSNWEAPWYLGDAVKTGLGHEHHELLALVAPRPFLLIGGDSADGARSWPFIEAVLPVYHLYGQPARAGLLNHRKGHNVPPEAERRVYEWIEAYA